jgi:hypothetical protein
VFEHIDLSKEEEKEQGKNLIAIKKNSVIRLEKLCYRTRKPNYI